jgi:hypothetical protein
MLRDPGMDPWVKSALLEEALAWSSNLGEVPLALQELALNEKLVSASSPIWLAHRASERGDLALARRLCARARQIDPAQPCPY